MPAAPDRPRRIPDIGCDQGRRSEASLRATRRALGLKEDGGDLLASAAFQWTAVATISVLLAIVGTWHAPGADGSVHVAPGADAPVTVCAKQNASRT